MKIEPFENNSIKVTLDSEDLEHFGIDLHRDTYGSPRLEQLFRRIGSKLRQEQGFNPEDLPVAIEAIPVNVQQLVLNFIPVPYADEAGNGYAHFSTLSAADEAMGLYGTDAGETERGPAYGGDEEDFADDSAGPSGDSFSFRDPSPFQSAFADKAGSSHASGSGQQGASETIKALAVTFHTFQEAGTACAVLPSFADSAESWLFRMESGQAPSSYILFIRRTENGADAPDFREIARILSEYGRVGTCQPSRLDYYLEHGTCLIRKEAIRRLRKFN